MIPLFKRPRQSLFDSFNADYQIPVTVSGNWAGINVNVNGVTVANGETVKLTPATLTITLTGSGVSSMLTHKLTVTYEDDSTVALVITSANDLTTSKTIKSITVDASQVVMGGTYNHTLTITPSRNFSGIFQAIKMLYDPDYIGDTADVDYLTSHSGTKAVSNAVMLYLEKYGAEVPDVYGVRTLSGDSIYQLARSIYARFADSWGHIYDALVSEYAPLENYSMREETTPDLTDEFSVSQDYAKSNERKTKSNVSTTQTDVTTDGDVYGFNSSQAVPATKNTSNGTVTVSGDADDNVTTDTETQTGKRIETHTGTTTLTRSGNIGVTTSQQMLQSEIDLRIKNHMEDIIFADVDTILTTAGFAPVLSKEIYII